MLLLLCGYLHFSASVKTKAYVGTLKLNITDNAPHTDSPLPFFKFLNTGNEGGAGFAIPPDLTVEPAFDRLSDGLPDFLVGFESCNLFVIRFCMQFVCLFS